MKLVLLLTLALVGVLAATGEVAAPGMQADERRAGAPSRDAAGAAVSPQRVRRACDAILTPADVAHERRLPVDRRDELEDFANGLRRGQVGCLRSGSYVEDVAIARSRITLRSYPGERARIVGRLWIRRGANDVTIQGLLLDGRNAARLPSPTVNGDGARFSHVIVTNRNTGICFILGSARYGRAARTVIEHSRIHHCGRLPRRNTEHGIYVSEASDTQIVGNEIYANADRGIQLYPNAQRTLISGNVIDGNGEGIIFSGDGGVASNGTVVEHNVISNSTERADVESWYPEGNPVGSANVVRNNCIWGGEGGTVDATVGGFVAYDNIEADPGYANPAAGDFTLDPASPCAALMAGVPVP